MVNIFKVLTIILSLLLHTTCAAVLSLFTPVKDLIQFNLIGIPVLHHETHWRFDPDVGAKRARQYQELNGRLGEKAIERLGLGVDGNDLERLAEQRARDEGHLGGLNYYLP